MVPVSARQGRRPSRAVVGFLILAAFVVLALYLVDGARQALCAQRADLDGRIASDTRSLERSRRFLREHPNGIPGIPARLIRQGIAEDAATLARSIQTRRNLSGLHC